MWWVGNSPQFCECCLFVGEREAVDPPIFWSGINLGGFYESAADLKSLMPPNANCLKGRWVLVALPGLPINRKIAFAEDLPVVESVSPKSSWQWLVKMAFLTPTLNGRARFTVAGSIKVAYTRQGVFYVWRSAHDSPPSCCVSGFRFGLYSAVRAKKREISSRGIIIRPQSEIGLIRPA